MAKMTKALRALLQRPGLIVAPGVYDALSARICEMVGYEAVSHSGYGTAAATLGQPDIGLLDMTEMARQVGSVANAVEIPCRVLHGRRAGQQMAKRFALH